ncbi:MAG TPA: hypothetical protein VFI27_08085 [candidate division Zixibacteria bacterium]|nr:hypothetical protein [candidate division Zixibacteria bacterium]
MTAGCALRTNSIIAGSLFLTTCRPSLLGPSSSVGGKSGRVLEYLYLVAVAVGVGDGVRVGVFGGRVGVADGVIVAIGRLFPVSEEEICCVGTGVYVGGTSDGSAFVDAGLAAADTAVVEAGTVNTAAGCTLVGSWTSDLHEISSSIPSRGKQERILIVPV